MTWVCVRGRAFNVPLRKALQLGHGQFHWGKPPPAADPRTLTRISVRGPACSPGGQND